MSLAHWKMWVAYRQILDTVKLTMTDHWTVYTHWPSFHSDTPSHRFARQLQIGNWVETRQNCLVLSPFQFTLPTWTRQDKTVLSCPCWQCERGITDAQCSVKMLTSCNLSALNESTGCVDDWVIMLLFSTQLLTNYKCPKLKIGMQLQFARSMVRVSRC